MCIMNKIDVFTIEKFIDRLEKFVKPNLPTTNLSPMWQQLSRMQENLISFGEKKISL